MLQTNVIVAKINNVPPSFITFIPNIKRCVKIAKNIVPAAINAPNILNLFMNKRILAISSTIPDPIRP